MRERWLLGQRRRRKKGRETNYTTDRIARLRECVLSDVNTQKERMKDREWERHEMC